MAKWLVAAAIAWPILLGGAVWQRAAGRSEAWTTVVYLAASRLCHQRPERSFQTAGVQWPVCGRCSGLYLAAPVGALVALGSRRRRAIARPVAWLAGASVPTVVTLATEWFGIAPVGSVLRFTAALPLGAVIAAILVGVVSGPSETIE